MANIKKGYFKEQRDELFEEIRNSPVGIEALKKLKFLREEFDLVNPDYSNVLKLLSENIYQDSTHFILELIQNADDAQFEEQEAKIKFVIEKDGIELLYNEKGFDIEDVIAITGAATSTKIRKEDSHRFIGEKGIGFKSVFALASEVEIESPPWHFLLKKERCIVPEIVDSNKFNIENGTRLKVTFTNSEDLNKIAEKLFGFFSDSEESFLFLQRLSEFTLEDRRERNQNILRLSVQPSDRNNSKLTLYKYPGNIKRDYIFYSEEIEFSADLVAERWESLNEPLKRKLILAIPTTETIKQIKNGLLFCFLPTKVTLPIPAFLQVDGKTKADREGLYDPDINKWNSYLFEILPEFLCRALLSLRLDQNFSSNLPDYIPTTAGTEQLKPVFEELISLLKRKPWIKTFSENDCWATPDDVVLLDDFLEALFKKYPIIRIQAEKVLGKKFVHSEWTSKNEWIQKFTEYGIERITETETAKILANIEIPSEFLENDLNLIKLYRYISGFKFERKSSYFYDFERSTQYNEELRNTLLRASIYPLEDGSFGSLVIESKEKKIFWISSRSKRKTGLDETLDFRIINPEYTYIAEAGGSASVKAKEKIEEINVRNDCVKELLKKLKIKELDDDNLLKELQIPYLLSYSKGSYNVNTRFAILNAIFEVYTKKRNNEEFLQEISKLAESLFPDKEGNLHKLKELTLPLTLRLYPVDKLYIGTGLEALAIPEYLLRITESNAKKINEAKEKERQKKKIEDWRQFLLFCRMKSGPDFSIEKIECSSPWDFSCKDYKRCTLWKEAINNDYTCDNPVTVKVLSLDTHTLEIIKSNDENYKLLADMLYSKWHKEYAKKIGGYTGNFWFHDLIPGYFYARYLRYSVRSEYVEDHLWAGVERKNIPLRSVSGKVTNPEEALRISASQKKQLGTSFDYFFFVEEAERDYSEFNEPNSKYHPVYLDTLGVRSPKIDDVNVLWEKLDAKDYGNIIEIAIEFIDMGIDPQFLKIYDLNSKKLIPAKEFCLGKTGPKGIPLIEGQYSSVGKELGQMLGLRDGSGSEAYEGLFDLLPNEEKRVTFEERLYELLNDWQSWDKENRKRIKKSFSESITQFGLEIPALIINNSEIVECLRRENILVFGISSPNDQKYAIEKAAKSIGFKLIEDIESDSIHLETNNESKLNEIEIKELDWLFNIYYESLEREEKSKLKFKLNESLRIDPWIDKIVRVSTLYKTFGKNKIKKKEDLPYFDESKKLIFVQHESLEEILSRILVYCNFERFKSALRDIRELKESKKFNSQLTNIRGIESNGFSQEETDLSQNSWFMNGTTPTPSTNHDPIATSATPINSETERTSISSIGSITSGVETSTALNIDSITSVTNPVETPDIESVSSLSASSETSSGKKLEGISKVDAAKEYLENIRKTIKGVNGKTIEEWKAGMEPERQNELLNEMSEKLTKSLLTGPEIHKKKVRSKSKFKKITLNYDEKLVIADIQDPKEFLRNEYRGRCQICGNKLKLINGDSLFYIFRILESKKGIWWYDYPFNILSMCPNCHGLAKNGGYDFTDLFHIAQELSQSNIFPIEIPEFNGDYYEADVKINGENRKLVISAIHLIHISSLLDKVDE